jgi:hypothetical protein
MRWRIMILATTTAIALCSMTSTASVRSRASGRVVGSEGAGLEKARLLFHPDPAGKMQRDRRSEVWRDTDSSGSFQADLEPGFYDVCVMAMAFTPQCRKIRVADGRPVKCDFSLRVDPLITEYLADKTSGRRPPGFE